MVFLVSSAFLFLTIEVMVEVETKIAMLLCAFSWRLSFLMNWSPIEGSILSDDIAGSTLSNSWFQQQAGLMEQRHIQINSTSWLQCLVPAFSAAYGHVFPQHSLYTPWNKICHYVLVQAVYFSACLLTCLKNNASESPKPTLTWSLRLQTALCCGLSPKCGHSLCSQ